jgi:hypothetical protein
VQSWKTMGFGTLSAPAVFTFTASPLAQPVITEQKSALAGEGAVASAVSTAFSTRAVQAYSADKGVPGSEDAVNSQEALTMTSSATADPASLAVSAIRDAAMVMPPAAAITSLSSEGTDNGKNSYASPLAVQETNAAGILAADYTLDPAAPAAEIPAASANREALPSGQFPDNDSLSTNLQDGDDGGSGLNQTGEMGADLVSARKGYIAPIDIVVGPMNDPGAKQQATLAAKKIEEKPNGAL